MPEISPLKFDHNNWHWSVHYAGSANIFAGFLTQLKRKGLCTLGEMYPCCHDKSLFKITSSSLVVVLVVVGISRWFVQPAEILRDITGSLMTDRKSMRVKSKQNWAKKTSVCWGREGLHYWQIQEQEWDNHNLLKKILCLKFFII